MPDLVSKDESYREATFAAGCFWGVEAAFRKVEGVIKTTVGYSGGSTKNPTYEQVSSGKTGHAESVNIVFDPTRISYEKLLDIFWNTHDPTTSNRQGPDLGSQYRSVIFYHDDEQKKAANESRDIRSKSNKYAGEIVTEIVPASEFYPAEDYHQQYFEKVGFV